MAQRRPCPAALFQLHHSGMAIDAMRYDWDQSHGKFFFYLDPEVPYVVGAHAELSGCENCSTGTGLNASEIDHWIIHSGGQEGGRLGPGESRS